MISLIVAASSNNVIGVDGGLPWHLSDDLKRFKAITMGKPIVMGRKTFESIGRALPGRHNIVISSQANFAAVGCEVVASTTAAIVAAGDADEIMVIGGGQVYRQFLPLAERVYLTRVQVELDGDAHFPPLPEREWRISARLFRDNDERNPYSSEFITLDRIAPDKEAEPMSTENSQDSRGVNQEDIHWDQDLSYGSYLSLDKLLECQKVRTAAHDEMMFMIIHQASELWMKLCIHEISAAMREVAKGRLGAVFKMLARVSRIQGQLRQSWSVLSTMTPADYRGFRDGLGQSSGVQSFQYREIEFALGNKHAALVEVHRQHPARYERLQKVLRAPSFYDLCLQHLARKGFSIPAEVLDRDWSQPYVPNAAVEAAWARVYSSVDDHWELYELAEKLVDLEYEFQMWRFSHMKTVERIIGHARGTGGTSGVAFLQKALNLKFFPELWSVRSELDRG